MPVKQNKVSRFDPSKEFMIRFPAGQEQLIVLKIIESNLLIVRLIVLLACQVQDQDFPMEIVCVCQNYIMDVVLLVNCLQRIRAELDE